MPHFVIMGAGRVGVMLARTLEASGHTVAVIDQDERAFQPLRKGFEAAWLPVLVLMRTLSSVPALPRRTLLPPSRQAITRTLLPPAWRVKCSR